MNKEQIENLTESFNSIAFQLKNLGLGNAATQMGAIEALSVSVKEAGDSIAGAINNLAAAVRESLPS